MRVCGRVCVCEGVCELCVCVQGHVLCEGVCVERLCGDCLREG